MKAEEVNLATINGGAALELFQRELHQVVANIQDPNTKATKPRTITLTFTFNPYPDRVGCDVGVASKSSSAPVDTTECKGNLYLVKGEGGKIKAFTRDIRQQALFAEEKEEPTNIVPMKGENAC